MFHFRFPTNMTNDLAAYRQIFIGYDQTLQSEAAFHFDCSRVSFIRPFGINILAALMQYHATSGNRVNFTPPANPTALKYLTDQGFFTHFLIEDGMVQGRSRQTSVALRQMQSYDGAYFERIIEWLEHQAELPAVVVRDLVSVSLVETINNVFDHSNSPIGAFISAQAYPREEILTLSVVDLGDGFYNTLKPFYPLIRSDCDAISKAIEEGVSSKHFQTRVRGVGLTNLVGFFSTRGAIEIISHRGYWRKSPETEVVEKVLPYRFPGACINMYINKQLLAVEDDFDADDVWG